MKMRKGMGGTDLRIPQGNTVKATGSLILQMVEACRVVFDVYRTPTGTLADAQVGMPHLYVSRWFRPSFAGRVNICSDCPVPVLIAGAQVLKTGLIPK